MWGSEATTKASTQQRDSADLAARLNVKFSDLRACVRGAALPSGTVEYNLEQPSEKSFASVFLFCARSWLCTQERWSPEVVSIFGAAARYRRATVGSSHDDAHPDNSTLHALHTGAVRPHTGFFESLFFISSRTGHGSSQVFEMLPAFSCISWACAFRAGDDALVWLPRRAGSSGI